RFSWLDGRLGRLDRDLGGFDWRLCWFERRGEGFGRYGGRFDRRGVGDDAEERAGAGGGCRAETGIGGEGAERAVVIEISGQGTGSIRSRGDDAEDGRSADFPGRRLIAELIGGDQAGRSDRDGVV